MVLPSVRSSFVGRERELKEVTRLLASSRLVTLTGAAGCGNTRLALRAVRKVDDRIEACATADEGRLNQVLSPRFVDHQPQGPRDAQLFLQHLREFLDAFSDSRFAVEEQIAEGNQVATRATWRAVHSGDFQGVPPTGREIVMSAVFTTRIRDGKVVENQSLFDQLSMLQQLGLVPPAG